jgi:hypothetical protein
MTKRRPSILKFLFMTMKKGRSTAGMFLAPLRYDHPSTPSGMPLPSLWKFPPVFLDFPHF